MQSQTVDNELRPLVVHLIDGCDTTPKLFLKKAAERGDRIAMREKEFGLWQSYSWREYRARAMRIAHGLRALGLRDGDVVSILSEDCKEWAFADMGAMLGGAVVTGVYPTSQSEQLLYYLVDSGARFLFVENDEQLDKYLAIRDRLPSPVTVFYFDRKGLRNLDSEIARDIEWLYAHGQAAAEENPGLIEGIIARSRPEDTAVIVYTSGTTGQPKGAMIPHRTLTFQMTAAPEYYRMTGRDEILTYLPLCHLAERLFSLSLPLATGATINFAESPSSVSVNLRELSPTVVFGVPRVWEKFYSNIATRMADASWVGRKAYALAVAAGRRRADKLIAGVSPSWIDEALYRVFDGLVFRNIKQLFGLDRASFMVSGAAPISEALLRWFLAIGLPIAELYGQTETGIVTMTRSGVFKPGTVGPTIPGADVRIAASGEIVVRSDGQFAGYFNQPEKTAEVLVDGWVHTGDVGRLDPDGSLRITDRIKDIIITAGGKNITPTQIENELKYSPYINDSVVIGDRRKFLSALIMIDKDNVEHYAQTRGIPFTDYRSLCARAEIVDLISAEIARVNEGLASVERIKRFRLIDVLLTAEDEELTPTMKLKRKVVGQKYAAFIEEMYAGDGI